MDNRENQQMSDIYEFIKRNFALRFSYCTRENKIKALIQCMIDIDKLNLNEPPFNVVLEKPLPDTCEDMGNPIAF